MSEGIRAGIAVAGIMTLWVIIVWQAFWNVYAAFREHRRRQRFPKRMIYDGELAYEIDHEGVIYPAPRWELRIERDGGVTPLRKSND